MFCFILIFNICRHNHSVLLAQVSEHSNHGEDDEIIATSNMQTEMVTKVINDPTRPIKRVYDEVVSQEVDLADDLIPGFHNVRSQLKRVRAAVSPPIPHSIDDEWSRTWRGKPC